jgi:hypothetical protein
MKKRNNSHVPTDERIKEKMIYLAAIIDRQPMQATHSCNAILIRGSNSNSSSIIYEEVASM